MRRLTALAIAVGIGVVSSEVGAQDAYSVSDAPTPTDEAEQNDLVKGSAATSVAVDQTKPADQVTPSGAFSYTVQLQGVAGVRVQPRLSLVYNSQASNGLAGMGWSLAGLPVIYRVNTGDGINYDGADSYAVNVSGWGTPDDPALQLVEIGEAIPRAARYPWWLKSLESFFQNFFRFTRLWVEPRTALRLALPTLAPSVEADLNLKWTSFSSKNFLSRPTASVRSGVLIDIPGLEYLVKPRYRQGHAAYFPCDVESAHCWLKTLRLPSWARKALGPLYPFFDDLYHTKVETWGEYHSRGKCDDGPCYWVLRDGNGNTLYFGGDDDWNAGRTISKDFPILRERFNGDRGDRGIFLWALYRVQDQHGNWYKVEYSRTDVRGGNLYPKYVRYAGSRSKVERKLELDYESRPDIVQSPFWFDQRLKSVSAFAGDALLRKYVLSYEPSPTSGRSRLHSLQQLGQDADPATGMPSYVFSYQDGGAATAKRSVDRQLRHAFVAVPGMTPLTGDINGDGIGDVVLVARDYRGTVIEYALGTANGLGSVVNYRQVWNPNQSRPDKYEGAHIPLLADIDGDGRSDLVFVKLGPHQITLEVAPGTSTGFGSLVPAGTPLPWPGDEKANEWGAFPPFNGSAEMNNGVWSAAMAPMSLMPPPDDVKADAWGYWQAIAVDVNDDKIADIVLAHPGAPTILVALGSAGGPQPFQASSNSVTPLGDKVISSINRLFAADINGDRYIDILVSKTIVLVATNNPVINIPGGQPEIHYALGGPDGLSAPEKVDVPGLSIPAFLPAAADVNGDTRTDIALNWDQIIWSRSGSSPPFAVDSIFKSASPQSLNTDLVGDFNGDGVSDLFLGLLPQAGLPPHNALSFVLGDPQGKLSLHTLNESIGGVPLAADINGDGNTDAVTVSSDSTGTHLWVAPGTPAGLTSSQRVSDDSILVYTASLLNNPVKTVTTVPVDVNGDGAVDLVFVPGFALNATKLDPGMTRGPYAAQLAALLSNPESPDLLTTVQNGFGGSIGVDYQPAPQVPNVVRPDACVSVASCERSNRSPRSLVSRVTRNDGRNVVRSRTYHYANGRIHPGLPFEDNNLGFSRSTSRTTRHGNRRRSNFTRIFRFTVTQLNSSPMMRTGS